MRAISRGWLVLALASPLSAGASALPEHNQRFTDAMATAVPAAGYQSKVVLADAIVRLVREGVIDPQKMDALYAQRGGMPAELKEVMAGPSHRPIVINRENAGMYVNLLWPIGLANRLAANNESPINGKSLYRYASTGGWNLGSEASGGAYFNKFPIVELTAAQERLVLAVAGHSFRPCCDNSTFYQDCNHGSALLGLLALGASQGLSEDHLYREALAFNAFWFPHKYAHTALYFKAVRSTEWRDVDPRQVMSAALSSGSGWAANVGQELQRRGLVPEGGEAGCNV
ncbi:MAG: hypothetical protein EPO20_00910 [Betaproteobacteria bacterium]|nr:MAG: hypothetical protein EPO20_00910 [Betaproteobacteria bacterium]